MAGSRVTALYRTSGYLIPDSLYYAPLFTNSLSLYSYIQGLAILFLHCQSEPIEPVAERSR